MEPIIIYKLFTLFRVLTQSVKVLTDKCVKGIAANRALQGDGA